MAALLVGEIKASAQRLAGRKKQVRYSPQVLRVALSLWLRSPKIQRVQSVRLKDHAITHESQNDVGSKWLDSAIAAMPRGMGESRLPCTVVVRFIANMLVDYTFKMMETFVSDLQSCSLSFEPFQNASESGKPIRTVAAPKKPSYQGKTTMAWPTLQAADDWCCDKIHITDKEHKVMTRMTQIIDAKYENFSYSGH